MSTSETVIAAILGMTFLQALLFPLVWGFVPALIARSKGRSGFWLWYLYGFFLLPVAVIHAVVLKSDQSAMDEKALPPKQP
jgi:hypothetical protein